MEKFLQTHGFKLSTLLSDIYGVSGRNLLYKMAEQGYLQPHDVIEAVNRKVKKPIEEIHEALKGTLEVYERQLLNISRQNRSVAVRN